MDLRRGEGDLPVDEKKSPIGVWTTAAPATGRFPSRWRAIVREPRRFSASTVFQREKRNFFLASVRN